MGLTSLMGGVAAEEASDSEAEATTEELVSPRFRRSSSLFESLLLPRTHSLGPTSFVSIADFRREVWPQESIGGSLRRKVALSLLLLLVLAVPFFSAYTCHFWHDTFAQTHKASSFFSQQTESVAARGAQSAALPPFAALCGALLAGLVADTLGRQKSLVFSSALNFIGMSTMSLMEGWHAAGAARFFTSAALGASALSTPLYLSETLHRRGVGGVAPLAAAALGILFSVVTAGRGWRYTVGLLAIVSGTFLAASAVLLPDTPLWLARCGALRAAEDVLSALRPPRDASEESEQLAAFAAAEEADAAAAAAAAESPWGAAAGHDQGAAEAEAGAALEEEAERWDREGRGLGLMRSLSGMDMAVALPPRLHLTHSARLGLLSCALSGLAGAAAAVVASPWTLQLLQEVEGKPHGAGVEASTDALASALPLLLGSLAGCVAVERWGRRRTLARGAFLAVLGAVLLAIALLIAISRRNENSGQPSALGPCEAQDSCGACLGNTETLCAWCEQENDELWPACRPAASNLTSACAAVSGALHSIGCPASGGGELGLSRFSLGLLAFGAAAGPVAVALSSNTEMHLAGRRGLAGGAAVGAASISAALTSAAMRCAVQRSHGVGGGAQGGPVAAAAALAVVIGVGARLLLRSPGAFPDTRKCGTYLELQVAWGHKPASEGAEADGSMHGGDSSGPESGDWEGGGRLVRAAAAGTRTPLRRNSVVERLPGSVEPEASPALSLLASAFLADSSGGGAGRMAPRLSRGESGTATTAAWWTVGGGQRGGRGERAGGGGGGGFEADSHLDKEAGRLLAVEAPGPQLYPGFQRLVMPKEGGAL